MSSAVRQDGGRDGGYWRWVERFESNRVLLGGGGGAASRCCDPHLAENVSTRQPSSSVSHSCTSAPSPEQRLFLLRLPPQHQSWGWGGSAGRFSWGTSAPSGPNDQSRAESQVGPSCRWRSAGGRGDGLLQLLAADLAGARLQQQVVAGVAHQHGVVQLLVRDGQLQVAAVFAEHVTAVSVDGERIRSSGALRLFRTVRKRSSNWQKAGGNGALSWTF